MGWEVLSDVRDGSRNLPEMRDGLVDPTGRFGTGGKTLSEVWDGSGGPSKGPGRVESSFGRSGRVGHPPEGLGRVVGPSQRSEIGQGILP